MSTLDESPEPIRFSNRAITVREQLLCDKIATGKWDTQTVVDLMQRRLVNPEDIERILDMTCEDLVPLGLELVKTLAEASEVSKLAMQMMRDNASQH